MPIVKLTELKTEVEEHRTTELPDDTDVGDGAMAISFFRSPECLHYENAYEKFEKEEEEVL